MPSCSTFGTGRLCKTLASHTSWSKWGRVEKRLVGKGGSREEKGKWEGNKGEGVSGWRNEVKKEEGKIRLHQETISSFGESRKGVRSSREEGGKWLGNKVSDIFNFPSPHNRSCLVSHTTG
jgi:hypothetical protein